MTQASVSLALPPRPPKRELLSHDLQLENSDYSSGEDEDSSPRKNRSSRSGGGGSAQALAGVSAECEGPHWKATVQQFDNFLCRVHAQVRQKRGREDARATRERGKRFSMGKKFGSFLPFVAKLFSQFERSRDSLPSLNCSLLPRAEGFAGPSTRGDEERWRWKASQSAEAPMSMRLRSSLLSNFSLLRSASAASSLEEKRKRRSRRLEQGPVLLLRSLPLRRAALPRQRHPRLGPPRISDRKGRERWAGSEQERRGEENENENVGGRLVFYFAHLSSFSPPSPPHFDRSNSTSPRTSPTSSSSRPLKG